MNIVADLHIHSRFSRATSKALTITALDEAARLKGVSVLGTGDFTHPLWVKELREELEEAEPGLYKRRGSGNEATRFLLSCEVSSIYTKSGAVRRIHTLLFAPSFAAVRKINAQLERVGNIHSDGRPILGLDVQELARIVFDADSECMVVPAHAWTPWFSVFGSKSGFNSLEEAFGEFTPHIYAIETGLSSDPAMNWRLSALDALTLISNSDCHSAAKIAREANVLDCELSYAGITDVFKKKGKGKFLHTLEFFPEEGKYHYDGHRGCRVSFKPREAGGNRCPKCGGPLTVGVLSRVEELADRPEGFVPQGAVPYKSLIPLQEIVAESVGIGVASKAVAKEYERLIDRFSNELAVLLEVGIKDIAKLSGPVVAEAVSRMREGKVRIEPGYDGVYGKISIFGQKEREALLEKQEKLF
jgi:uncharacterized protein (TIGR00375 family)